MRRLSLNRLGAGQNIPKNRCRTTVAERMVETLAELPFIGDQVGLFKPRPSRPQRTCRTRSANARFFMFLNGFCLYGDLIPPIADRNRDRKLARLRRPLGVIRVISPSFYAGRGAALISSSCGAGSATLRPREG